MMRLLADENIPLTMVVALRSKGHDVAWVAESNLSIHDTDVLHRAAEEQRVLLTFDKELAVRKQLPAESGVVLLRISNKPALATSLLLKVLDLHSSFAGRFVVVEEQRVRDRAL